MLHFPRQAILRILDKDNPNFYTDTGSKQIKSLTEADVSLGWRLLQALPALLPTYCRRSLAILQAPISLLFSLSSLSLRSAHFVIYGSLLFPLPLQILVELPERLEMGSGVVSEHLTVLESLTGGVVR